MPAKCDLPGLSFQYPDNWTLDQDDAPHGCDSVTVYSPGGAFWSVSRHAGSAEPSQLAQAAVEAMQAEYDSLESERTEETVAEHHLIGYDLAFYCMDLTSTAGVRAVRINDSTYTVFFQAEDREMVRVGPVFQAITTSLFSGLKDLRWQR
jgi:hypothetical protein